NMPVRIGRIVISLWARIVMRPCQDERALSAFRNNIANGHTAKLKLLFFNLPALGQTCDNEVTRLHIFWRARRARANVALSLCETHRRCAVKEQRLERRGDCAWCIVRWLDRRRGGRTAQQAEGSYD